MRLFEIDDDARQMLCERCRKFVPVTDIRYVPRGDHRMSLCKSCLSLFNTESEKKQQQASVRSNPSRSSYLCQRCNYKFKFDTTSHQSLRCPYCGKTDHIIEQKKTDADSLLKQSDDF